ncbi:MAG: Eco57I restriction-modification methylase domain-containing protein [Planctomycetota bacterium]|mgnify:CR=1 FL=1
MPHANDLDLTAKDVGSLSSADAVAGWFTRLGYPTGSRRELTAASLGVSAELVPVIRGIELLAVDTDDFFRVLLVTVKSITAKVRNELARRLGQTNVDHLIVLTSNFDVLEFVLLDKRNRQQRGPIGGTRPQIVTRIVTVHRKSNTQQDRRILRRLTWTSVDGLAQFEKLRNVFESAAFATEYFQNRALFADHYLTTRLREDSAWRENPSDAFAATKSQLQDARTRFSGKPETLLLEELYAPLWKLLGFRATASKPSTKDRLEPDYDLKDRDGKQLGVAFTYRWDRWLDGPDPNDPEAPDENPGAAVVSALGGDDIRWAIVTNGKLWRLYSKDAHSRATNFYEVDLEEALAASDETDPNEAFRYWWLFFRADAFKPIGDDKRCWLDAIVQGSRDYAKRLGDRLKDRVFVEIFPHLAHGFLADRKQRLGIKSQPTEAELSDTYQATLTLLYRMLFLLYAEARDLLPIRESPYEQASLKRIKQEIAEHAGVAEGTVGERLGKIYDGKSTALFDRLSHLFAVMDKGDAALNVPCYNGGLFVTDSQKLDDREHRIARFLIEHKVPDRFLAVAIDRLSRDVDDKTLGLVFIDYKSLEVRHLGSIYEGLLEFKLKIADDDLTTTTEKKKEKYIPLSEAKPGRGKRTAEATVHKGEVYLSNDKAERKATGSYYTPDPIVEYIVEHTVGPVLKEKLDGLRDEFRKAGKTFHKWLDNARNNPGLVPQGKDHRTFAGEKSYAEHKELVDRLFDFKVLDPAMGSGHFLVETVDFITDTLLDFLNRFPNNPVAFALERTRNSILDALDEQGVKVDAAKLTDVNLLKRHVLKRCIYGVDLNPMAVELAKVSLWLDAFTLGAPLSFLDHHLRGGNSLIGATFKNLEAATQGQLFSIDYQPLLDAIRNVLFVNAMADATAAEVHESVRRYGDARKALSGYKIVFDLLVADHFLIPNRDREGADTAKPTKGRRIKGTKGDGYKPSSLLAHASDLDLKSRDAFIKSLSNDAERKLVGGVEELADRSDRRFFHWEIEFPEIFFGFEDTDQRRIKSKNMIRDGSAGFDAVIGNPPYDVLAEKELETRLDEVLGYVNAEPIYAPARKGKQNLYKLFVCRDIALPRRNGRVGHIVPMPLLGDEQAVGVRKKLLTDTSLRAVEAFPQKDDPSNRVFEDAKLSTCVFVTENSTDRASFRVRVHPGKDIVPASPSLVLKPDDVKLYDPENQPIVACSQEDWDLAVRIIASGRMRRLGEFCGAYQGEVNETTDGEKGNISENPKDGPRILRGSNVCLYVLREASQGEDIYLRKGKYLDGKRQDAKAWHHKERRIGLQESSPQNNFRRIIASVVPKGEFCNHLINYFPEQESRIPLETVLAILDSKLADWYFRLGSTNAHVSHYQLYILPTPAFEDDPSDQPLVSGFDEAVRAGRQDEAFALVEPLLRQSPFPVTVRDCMVRLVERIIAIELKRGDIARTERSALDPKAQPLQELLDRIIFRMAGLSDAESKALEQRLAKML